jgi:hypothetical protein
MAYETQVIVSQDDIEKAWFMSRLKFELDESNRRNVWINQGVTQGIAQGVYTVARNLFKQKIPFEVIMQSTGLSEAELKALERDIHKP